MSRPYPELFVFVLNHELLLIKILKCDEVEKGANLSLQRTYDNEDARRRSLKSKWISLTSHRHDIKHQQLRLKVKKIAAALSIVIQKDNKLIPPASHCMSVVSFLKDDTQFEYRKTFTDSLDLFFCQIPFNDCRHYYDNAKSLTILLKLDTKKTEFCFAEQTDNDDERNDAVWDFPCIQHAVSEGFQMKNTSLKEKSARKPFIVSTKNDTISNGSVIVDWLKQTAIREGGRIAWKIFYGLLFALLAYLLPASFVTELKKLIGWST